MSTRDRTDSERRSAPDGTPPVNPERDGAGTDGPSEPDVTERVLTPTTDDGEFEAVVDLLDDEYTQRILLALAEDSRPACELMDACDASRATVYRRLNRLQEHGLVEVGMEFHRKGHHRKVFESLLERATVEMVDGTARLRLAVDAPDPGDDPRMSVARA